MEQNAFELISSKVGEALEEKGFKKAKAEQQNSENRSVMFTDENTAYTVIYHTKEKRFELKSCEVEDGKPDLKWKSNSVWLFDTETDGVTEAESISNDFIDTIEGPKQAIQKKNKKKRKKDDENNPDPVFFFNRFVGVFSELRNEMNEERALYGDIRDVHFAREHLLPKIKALCSQPNKKDQIKRCCDLLNDLYVSGDMNVRSIITIVILNGLDENIVNETMKPNFSEDLLKGYTAGLKFKGKTVKPEKKKKERKYVAETLNEMKR